MSANETIPAARYYSVPPTSISELPPPPKSGGMFKWLLAGALTLCLAGGAGFFALRGLADQTLGFGAGSTGGVVVTAVGPNGAAINGLRVIADGTVRCESSPCTIGDLKTGTHFVEVEAPGFVKTAARAVAIERGGEAKLDVELAPVAAAKQAAAPPVEPATAPALDLDREPQKNAAPSEPVRSARSEPIARNTRADKKEALSKKEAEKKEKADAKKEASTQEATGNGVLNINSIPVANVVLDGKPMGSTPLVGISVAPGPHSVVFIHPEHGRKASGATVKAGQTSTVAVKF